MKRISEGTTSLYRVTCEDCGLTFDADRNIDIRYWKQGIEWPMYECPKCHKTAIDWDKAKDEFDVQARMAVKDSTIEARRRANRWWAKLRKKEGQ